MNTRQLKVAEKILRDYTEVIRMSDPTLYGLPVSYLAYNKTQIKQAIVTALSQLEMDEIDIRETLVHSYLHLAQFIPDEHADIAQRGQQAILSGDINHPDLNLANEALKIINQIKADMEELKKEVFSILRRKGYLPPETDSINP